MSPAKTVSVGGLMALLLTGLGSEAAAQDTRPASPPVGIRSVITHRVPTGVIAPTRGDVPSSLKSPRRSSAATKASIIGLAALGSLFAGGFSGGLIENAWFPCSCDDHGLRSVIISAPIGAVAAESSHST